MWDLYLSSIRHEASVVDRVSFGIELFINNLSLIDILITVLINLIDFYF